MKLTFTQKLIIAFFIAVALFFVWEIYVPKSLAKNPPMPYTVAKGTSTTQIGVNLQREGIIKSARFFKAYAIISGSYKKLQAGSYELSPSMSLVKVIQKIASGDVIKNNLTIIEGWDLRDVGALLETKKIISQTDFLALAKSKKPALEGYLFPDTYELSQNATGEEFIQKALANFDKKLTPELRAEITKQKKTIFQIITMASMVEKEVQTPEDKSLVAGILWKRIKNGMPLQVDATVNYATGKKDSSTTTKDTTIDSPYNTYKYYGLPLGPICNPGMDAIVAAIYPQKSDYWYYLSVPKTGETIFSKTLEEHNAAVAKYLKP